MQTKLRQLYQRMQDVDPAGFSVAVGFDGFVDEIVEVVDRRESFDSYTRMTKMSQFGERIIKAAGLSTNIEFVPQTMKLGGNGPIMANALVKAGTSVSYVGSLGYPNIHPVFSELTDGCTQVFSIAEPGHTDAVEFDDGKVMLGKMESLNDVNWSVLQREVGIDNLKKIFSGADLVATVNWTMTPYMNEIWAGLLELCSPRPDGQRPYFFVDLADPSKRSPSDILESLDLIGKFSSYSNSIAFRREASHCLFYSLQNGLAGYGRTTYDIYWTLRFNDSCGKFLQGVTGNKGGFAVFYNHYLGDLATTNCYIKN